MSSKSAPSVHYDKTRDALIIEGVTFSADFFRGLSERQRFCREKLSPRKFEILRKIAAGKTQKEISVELGIDQKTVNTHKAKIMRQLGITTNAELFALTLVSIRNQ